MPLEAQADGGFDKGGGEEREVVHRCARFEQRWQVIDMINGFLDFLVLSQGLSTECGDNCSPSVICHADSWVWQVGGFSGE